MATFTMESCVRGYHVYGERWIPVVGEVLGCTGEPGNRKDSYAVAVCKDSATVGHLPRKYARCFSIFLRRGGTISCEITGRRKYSRDLPQGGLEVPCVLTFKGDEKEIKKLMQLFTVKDQVSMQSL